jgi:translation elongation factor EF-1alpha
MPANSEKEHLSIVICGHVDSGKSTTTGRLIFELGGLPERELEKLKQEAERLGKVHLLSHFTWIVRRRSANVVSQLHARQKNFTLRNGIIQ